MHQVVIVILNLIVAYTLAAFVYNPKNKENETPFSLSFFGAYIVVFVLFSLVQALIMLPFAGADLVSGHSKTLLPVLLSYVMPGIIYKMYFKDTTGRLLRQWKGNLPVLLVLLTMFCILGYFSPAIVHTDGLSMLALSHEGPWQLWRLGFLNTMWGPVNTLMAFNYNLYYFNLLSAWGYVFLFGLLINNILNENTKWFEYIFWAALFSSKYFLYHFLLTHNSVFSGILLFYMVWFFRQNDKVWFYPLIFLFGFYRMDTVIYTFLLLNILTLLDFQKGAFRRPLILWALFCSINFLVYLTIDAEYFDSLSKERAFFLSLILFGFFTLYVSLSYGMKRFKISLDFIFEPRFIFFSIVAMILILFKKPLSLYNTSINLFAERSRWPQVWWFILLFFGLKFMDGIRKPGTTGILAELKSKLLSHHLFWILYLYHIFFMVLFRSGYRVGFGDSGKRMFIIVLIGFFASFFTLKRMDPGRQRAVLTP